MKRFFTIVIMLFIGAPFLYATQWQYKSLAELLTDADLVVVGRIDSAEGRVTPPPDQREASLVHEWKSRLEVTRVLKGSDTETAIVIQWDEIGLSGVPDYKLGEERIWILKKAADGKTYSTLGRPDTVLLLKELPAVEHQMNALNQSVK